MKRIHRRKSLGTLTACADSSRSGDLPSWVPDLRRSFGQNTVLWKADQVDQKLKIGITTKFSSDGYRLAVRGGQIGKIKKLSDIADVLRGFKILHISKQAYTASLASERVC